MVSALTLFSRAWSSFVLLKRTLMDKDLLIIVIVVGLAIVVWVPAIVLSVLYVIRKGKQNKNQKTE